MFSDKLNFLISIVGISGGELAHAVSLDPSYISRLRHGKRDLPKHQHFMEPISLYFATHIISEYQKKLICDAMGLTVEWPKCTEKAKDYIENWLVTENILQHDIMSNVLKQIAKSFPLDSGVYVEPLPDLDEYRNDTRESYFGISGRQEAFLRFLTFATDAEEFTEIQLFSNEDLSWLSESPDFARTTLSLLKRYASVGNKVKVIHSLSQDTDEMLYTLRRWIPIYLTGYVEPYYYPKVRDKFDLRTIFILPGTAAMVASSLEGSPSEKITFLFTNPKIVNAFEAEMKYLVSQSKPLAKVFSVKSKDGINGTLKEFFYAKEDTIVLHDNISPFILSRDKKDKNREMNNFCFKHIESLLKKKTYTELISIPEIDKIVDGKIPVHLSELIGDKQRFFTKEEYLENLEYIIKLLSENDNYNLLIKNHAFKDMFICVKKGKGVLITKAQGIAMMFYIDQPNVIEVIWEFLKVNTEEMGIESNAEVICKMKELIKTIHLVT